jgi:hypothetical protein
MFYGDANDTTIRAQIGFWEAECDEEILLSSAKRIFLHFAFGRMRPCAEVEELITQLGALYQSAGWGWSSYEESPEYMAICVDDLGSDPYVPEEPAWHGEFNVAGGLTLRLEKPGEPAGFSDAEEEEERVRFAEAMKIVFGEELPERQIKVFAP